MDLLRACALSFFALTLIHPATTPAQRPDRPTQGTWGDQGNGTYANPILPADFSDLDAIRVGDRFYAISSTFQYSPGMAVLESLDLVNWHILGHVVPDLNRISPALNWNHMDRAGRGIWAGAIRQHAGRFWVYFGTPDEGLFMSTATTPAGPWTPVTRVLPTPGWDDPCPFWDDDGQGYLVTTHFKPEDPGGKPYNIHLFKLTPDGRTLQPGFDRILHQSPGSEANKLYKIHGLYFHYFSEVRPEGRVAMMERASSLNGPWEIRQLNHVHPAVDKEPNQGGLIELPSGQWYFLTHQGAGDWEGRAAVLLPVTWQEGWPILGAPGPDGIGNMVWHAPKPIPGHPLSSPVTSDDFASPALKPEWEWNYQPRSASFSLTERPGFLRLHAFPTLRSGDLRTTGNLLTQRAMRSTHNQITLQLNLSGMADGQRAGLLHYAKTFAAIEVIQHGATRTLNLQSGLEVHPGPTLTQPTLWLRSTWGFDGLSQFAWSTDGQTFTPLGSPYPLIWGDYRGDRIGIFTTNPTGTRGFLDVDAFRYEAARQP